MIKIKIKDFAKIPFSQSFDENSVDQSENVAVAIVSASGSAASHPADDEHKPMRKPRSKIQRSPRKSRFSVNGKYHKISEYFSIAKKDYTIPPISADEKLKLENAKTKKSRKGKASRKRKKVKAEDSREPPAAPMCKELQIVLERIDETDLAAPFRRTRKSPSDQEILDEFIDCKPIQNEYFTTYQSAAAPLPEAVCTRIEETLGVENNMNVENVDNGLTQEGKSTDSDVAKQEVSEASTEEYELPMPIEQMLELDSPEQKGKASKRSRKKAEPKPAQTRKRRCARVPPYKIIAGTRLAVDAFRFGDIDGVENYFLSHFHADHYIGLKKSFSKRLYLSEVTGRFVEAFIKVERRFMHVMRMHVPIIVDDVEVTALDANHCPGAVMFLFRLRTGECVLHTGDFRASSDMEEYPEFWNHRIDTIYLDTTYLSNKYDFKSQHQAISDILAECGDFFKAKEAVGMSKCLIVCGAYKIGKEKVWLSIAQKFNLKVFVDSERRKAMECLENSDLLSTLTVNPLEANIHVLSLGNVTYPMISGYAQKFTEHFDAFLAIRPSGHETGQRKPYYRGRISMLPMQYSEHSSYHELERFIKYLQPKQVISTVPFSAKSLENVPRIPLEWLKKEVKPKRTPFQPTMQDMFRMNQQRARLPADSSVKIKAEKKDSEVIEIHDSDSDDFMP